MPGGLDFDFRFGRPGGDGRRGGDARMRILVMGNFRGARPVDGGLSASRIAKVDVDSFDALLERIAPALEIVPAGGEIPIPFVFREMEDFEPDSLWRGLDVFARLRDLRKRLLDPATFAAAAAELRGSGADATVDAKAADATADAAAPAAEEEDDDTLARLLGKPAEVSGATPPRGADVSDLIRSIVAPHVVPGADPRQDEFVAMLDRAAADLMRAILHDPGFRRLEAAWRSLRDLVTGVETDETLSIHVLDASREEIAADLDAAGGDLDRWGLWRLLVEQGVKSPGGEPWSVLVGDYTFGPDTADIAILGALGVLAAQAGGPFLAAASPAFLGTDRLEGRPDATGFTDPEEHAARRWSAMRAAPMAPFLGLALPRVLLRLPYGPGGEEIDAFDFDEVGPERAHESFLWGNPAFGIAKLLARSFTGNGPAMEPGDLLELDDLPAFSYVDADGEKGMMPAAEAWLSERAGEAILERGLMPLLSVKGSNTARFLRIQSIAEPAAPLRGFWTRGGAK